VTGDHGDAANRPLTRVVLRDQRDADGLRSLTVIRGPDGGIEIDGHDLGDGVERILGFREYEWTWDIEADAVPAAIAALGGAAGDDPLALLVAWSAAHGGIDPGSHLREAGVPITFWSRIGD
jgi:hypothetical protein